MSRTALDPIQPGSGHEPMLVAVLLALALHLLLILGVGCP